MDFITGLPKSKGFTAVLVVVDRFSIEAIFIPTTEQVSSSDLAGLFRDHVWKEHGLPRSVISDRGPQFSSQFTRELNSMLGIETKLSTAFHPQTDGQTERVNQELEKYLRMYVAQTQEKWSDWLAMAQFTHNNLKTGAHGKSPFEVKIGRAHV